MDKSKTNQDAGTIFLWTNPRSLSTVFTKCISFVDNIQVWFEPYSCAFGNNIYCNQFNYPTSLMNGTYWRNETTEQQHTTVSTRSSNRNWFEERIMTYPWVKEQLETPEPEGCRRFIKNMAYDINGDIDFEYLPNVKCRHTFLIRNPLKVYPSCKTAFLTDPGYSNGLNGLRDVDLINDFPYFPIKSFYKIMHKLWCAVESVEGTTPVVIDADELSNKPEILLRKYFDAVGLPWSEKYLSWNASREITKEWKTARERMNPKSGRYKVWYKTAIESSQFIPATKVGPSTRNLSLDIRECVEESMPYYESMFEKRIKTEL
ncbi:hypothetical protein HOLleu_02575 [Holothuria leucospilota]|uniref:Sulfotransferase family protein n=1 Tax=Holothuria leucospilota TaxID=206669 RepID=A0A9Q1HLE9_HOLLE|nr:hypothetical protein HOLleu_02575 [Holothuria leucospilota]